MKTKNFFIASITILAFFALFIVAPISAKEKSKSSDIKKSVTSKAKEKASSIKGKININKADVEELSLLKGVGEKTAKNIIKYRKEIGSFKKIEDLMEVKGIGEKTFKAIKPFIKVK